MNRTGWLVGRLHCLRHVFVVTQEPAFDFAFFFSLACSVATDE